MQFLNSLLFFVCSVFSIELTCNTLIWPYVQRRVSPEKSLRHSWGKLRPTFLFCVIHVAPNSYCNKSHFIWLDPFLYMWNILDIYDSSSFGIHEKKKNQCCFSTSLNAKYFYSLCLRKIWWRLYKYAKYAWVQKQ